MEEYTSGAGWSKTGSELNSEVNVANLFIMNF